MRLYFNEIPGYLQDSTLYQSFNAGDEGCFEIADNCFKPDTSVNSTQELFHLMSTIRFWGLQKLPTEVYSYVIDAAEVDADEIRSQCKDFEEHTEYLNMLLDLRAVEPSKRLIRALSHRCCDTEVLQHLVTASCELSDGADFFAARTGNVNCLRWIHSHTEPNKSQKSMLANTFIAATMGELAVLKYLHEAGVDWNGSECFLAAQGGHLSCLKYLHENGCSWDGLTLVMAASYGRLDCLTYAYENGCRDWPGNTTEFVAVRGHLDCLQYAHEHGCAWGRHTVSRALHNGQWACAAYAYKHNAPYYDLVLLVCCAVRACAFVVVLCTATEPVLLPSVAQKVVTQVIPLLVGCIVVFEPTGGKMALRGLIVLAVVCMAYCWHSNAQDTIAETP